MAHSPQLRQCFRLSNRLPSSDKIIVVSSHEIMNLKIMSLRHVKCVRHRNGVVPREENEKSHRLTLQLSEKGRNGTHGMLEHTNNTLNTAFAFQMTTVMALVLYAVQLHNASILHSGLLAGYEKRDGAIMPGYPT